MEQSNFNLLAICSFLAIFVGGCAANSASTHIDNNSNFWTIVASTNYGKGGGSSKFIDRHIPPGGSAVDTYTKGAQVTITVQVLGAPYNNKFTVSSDTSVIAEDSDGDPNQPDYGVDFWVADSFGNSRKNGAKLVTIFGPGPATGYPKAPDEPWWHLYWFDHEEKNLQHDEHGTDRVKCTTCVPTATRIVFRPDETSWCYAGYPERGCSGVPVQQCDGALDITHLPWYTIHKK